jgi:uncharacterized membrane protein
MTIALVMLLVMLVAMIAVAAKWAYEVRHGWPGAKKSAHRQMVKNLIAGGMIAADAEALVTEMDAEIDRREASQ